ncbi:TonB-dependent receptor domain-containing protein [Steroidobacter flavus]|uniref:TonB-dependent receptor domain-containing protein n=1 Tax=Steroidobacter flavus TaxID=1842136 RepID=A0ABV8T2V3_9GAMM
MRTMVASAVVCISIAGVSAAGEADAAIRRPTNIPEQSLDEALQVLASERGVQMIYPYTVVGERLTRGVHGELTLAEALDQLLQDTGLRYRYLDQKTITIAPVRKTSETEASERGEGSWGRLRLAQVAGQASRGASVSGNVESAALEEVIVTALRREQRTQDVPAAISVLSGEDIKAKGAQDMRDYLTTIPGVNYSERNVGGMSVTIRGISDGVGARDALTGLYIDEAPLTDTSLGTLDPDIYDVDRVEVLKGPQGTLYGAGSMGGTVRVLSKKPKLDTFEAAFRGMVSSVDHGDTGERIDGVVNVPLMDDRVALRMSAGYRKDGGWIDDVTRGDKDANTIEKKNARAQLLVRPADGTSVILGFLYQNQEIGLPPFDDPGGADFANGKIYRQSRESDTKLFSLTLNQDWDRVSLVAASNYLTKDGKGTYDATSTSQRNIIRALTGITLGPLEGLGLQVPGSLDQFTQEVRLSSVGDQRLEWLVGGYYSDVSTETGETIDLSQAPSLAGVLTSDGYYEALNTRDTQQIAGFSELTFNFTDRLSLTAGLRLFNVREQSSSRSSGLLAGEDSATRQDFDETSTTKKVALQFEASRDHMIYAQAVQGYRNGGANTPVPPSCAAALQEAGYDGVASAFDPDDLWNYEIGSKNTLFNGRMQLNAAAFYIDWKDMQTTVPLSCGIGFVVNAGEAASKGIELETALRPLDGLTVNLSASYLDAELTGVAPGSASKEGDRLPQSAKLSWNISALYEHPIGGELMGFARSEVNHVGDRWNSFWPIGPRSTLLDSYTTVNARIGVGTERWTVAIFGTNLTDERYLLDANLPTYELVGRPRTVGLEAQVGF